MLFQDGREYLQFRVKLSANIDKVFTLLQSTVEGKNQQIVRTKGTPFEAYDYFCNKFGKDPVIELKELRRRFKTIRCPNLRDYVHNFEVQLADYLAAGGDEFEVSLFDSFLDQIPDDKYKTLKMMFTGNTLREAIDYFRRLAEREATSKYSNTNSTSEVKGYRVSQVNRTPVDAIKCRNCGGIGHSSDVCPSPKNLCHHCGGTDHHRRKCSLKNKRPWFKIKKAMIELLDQFDDSDSDKEVSEGEIDIYQPNSEDSEEEEEDIHEHTVSLRQLRVK